MAAATFGAGAAVGAGMGAAVNAGASHGDEGNDGSSNNRAVVQYDYEKAEDNEIELREGEQVTDIDFVDEDWWMGTNAQGERGLFPSNYVDLVEGDAATDDHGANDGAAAAPALPTHPSAAEPAAPEAPASSQGKGKTAKALYEYEAAEDNELSFPEDAIITQLSFPDEDWWLGYYNGQSGLFPANYVEIVE
jgi:hypothetical protein